MKQYKAGYVIEEVFNLYSSKTQNDDFENTLLDFQKLCYFQINGIDDFELNENPDKINYCWLKPTAIQRRIQIII